MRGRNGKGRQRQQQAVTNKPPELLSSSRSAGVKAHPTLSTSISSKYRQPASYESTIPGNCTFVLCTRLVTSSAALGVGLCYRVLAKDRPYHRRLTAWQFQLS